MAGEIIDDLEGKPKGAGAKGAEPGAPPKKKDAHNQKIIVLVSIVGVIVAYLTYRKISSSSAATTTTTTTPLGYGSTGTVAGTGASSIDTTQIDQYYQQMTQAFTADQAANQAAQQGFQTYLDTIQTELATLIQSTPAASSPPGGGSSPHAPTTGTMGVAGGVGGTSAGLTGGPIQATSGVSGGPQYAAVANPAALKALPAGTNLFQKVGNSYQYLTPAQYKALPTGTTIYTAKS